MALFREKLIQDKKGRTLSLRPLHVHEAAALLEFKKQVSLQTDFLLAGPETYNNRSLEQEETWIEKINLNPRSFLLAADFEGTLVGLLDFHAFSDKKRFHRGLLGLSFLENWRGLGLGRSLMVSLLELLREHPSLEFIELSVMSNNQPAVQLYRKLGFQEVFRMPQAFLFQDQRVDEIYMRKLNR